MARVLMNILALNRDVEEVDGGIQSASVTFTAIIHAIDQAYGP